MTTATTTELAKTLDEVVARLNEIETKAHLDKGYTNFPADIVHWSEKQKFVYIDIGGSGAWLVEKATGEIYNIAGYGKPDHNKKRKADLGNIYTVNPQTLWLGRHNYLR